MFASHERRLLELNAGGGLQTVVFRDQLALPETPVIFDQADARHPRVVSETEFRKVNLEKDAFPAGDDSFDVVVWNGELVTLKNIVRPLSEIRRVVRPGGYFLLSVPNLAALHNRVLLLLGLQPTALHIDDGDHVRGFAMRSMSRFLAKRSGFLLLETAGVGVHPLTSAVIPRPLCGLSHTALWFLNLPERKPNRR